MLARKALTLHYPLNITALQRVLHNEHLQCRQSRMDVRIVSRVCSEGACVSATGGAQQLSSADHSAARIAGRLTSLVVPALHDIVDHGFAVQSVLMSHYTKRRQTPVHAVQAQVRRKVVCQVLLLQVVSFKYTTSAPYNSPRQDPGCT